MRRAELDYILMTMLGLDRKTDTIMRKRKAVSDLNFTVDRPLQVEQDGELIPVEMNPPLDHLTPYQTEMIALNLINGNPRLTEDLIRTGSCDASYSVADMLRFRVNVFTQRSKFSIVMRKLNTEIPTLAGLKLPTLFREVAKEQTGLVLVTGATGSGKTTTLAAILHEINNTKSVHIITLEDPVEFIHQHKKSTFNQREMGSDFSTFSAGLRAALRQAPKVVLVGEMRDRETVEIGLGAAETGHLVLSTLHTIDAGQTINRVLGMFETEEQEQVRTRLADTLRWIISQRLAPRIGGGRFALIEVMGANLRTKDSIIHGESEGKSFYDIIESNHSFGWRNFDQACLEAYEQNIITEESALNYSSKRGFVSRGIDAIKKARGEGLGTSDLKMKVEPVKSKGPPSFPTTFKMK
ncbi:MAG: PilT/PilU family type 4a pilus ATPase [Verrucomicrobiota bacterium]|jgi:twitching motility protein PilT